MLHWQKCSLEGDFSALIDRAEMHAWETQNPSFFDMGSPAASRL